MLPNIKQYVVRIDEREKDVQTPKDIAYLK